jgi:hypothetical protein
MNLSRKLVLFAIQFAEKFKAMSFGNVCRLVAESSSCRYDLKKCRYGFRSMIELLFPADEGY